MNKKKNNKKKITLLLAIIALVGIASYGAYSYYFAKGEHEGYTDQIYISSFDVEMGEENNKKNWFIVILLVIAITPYLRYLLLANHSYRHSFFTFRDQIVTIMCLIIISLELKKEKYKNGTNNTNAMFKRRKNN